MQESNEVTEAKSENIRWQVVSEQLHRHNLNRLKQFGEWLKLEGVDDEIFNHFLTWANHMIEEQLKMRMQMKKFMQDGIKDALIINALKSGDGEIH